MTEHVVTDAMIEAAIKSFAECATYDLGTAVVERAILAAIKAAPSPWRPIAKAPRDGHKYGGPPILGWDGSDFAIVQWARHTGTWVGDINPTHFQILHPPGDEP